MIEDVKELAEREISMKNDWCNMNILSINYQKTKFLPFAIYKDWLPNFSSHTLSNGQQIKSTDNIKYLGITIDQHLRWNVQLNINILKRLTKNIVIISSEKST